MSGNYATDRLDGVTHSGASELILRKAGWRDCWRLWRWRNHPMTRPMMRNKSPIGLAEHVRWFATAQRQPARVIYVAMAGCWPVGSGRLDFSDLGRVAEFDVIVAPRWRGHGYGSEIVRLLATNAEQMGAMRLVADVWRGNGASIVAFQRAGFMYHGQGDGLDFARLERRCA
jgi:UDP-2,4-diacetamido-2,4,6-trideoxy-beta-L-altropyranose hydrolase